MHHTIDVDHLHFRYPNGPAVLDDISFHIEAGERIALVGPNGAGKSTLMLHLNGILRAESGGIRLCGMELGDDTLRAVRRAVGLVFQNPDDQLFSPTVFDDVAFGPIYQGCSPEETRERVRDALAAVHMEAYIQRVSHHLSVGEKKRIAIATVLSMDPEILVLDEPTAGLDPQARRNFIRLLVELKQTMLVATHDLALVREICARTIIMDSGRIAADGPTAKILADGGLLAQHGLLAD
ncbi:MAG: cobalt ABC transporter ATP-binding protein [Chloroflexi bacterium RBG_13_60_9]|nr:MAG: cobalt ABC transporter ATP-binding protein [Chloroflexi bacterium RBG_13_60_9]